MPEYGPGNSCHRKRFYYSERGATESMVVLILETDERRPLKVYKCDWCEGWHVGHQETRRDKEEQT